MTVTVPRLVCTACGWTPGPPEIDPYPFRCPNAGTDDGDHVIARVIAPAAHPRAAAGQGFSLADSRNPFLRYRTSLYSWQLARSRGLTDADYVSIVERVDAAVARIVGHGFRITPFSRAEQLSGQLGFERAGGVWVKDETGNVSGSHKARHLMGVALYLEVLRHLGIDRDAKRPLAVASCGNAALAAAIVARAIDRRLLVFVLDHAAPTIVARLEALGATVTRCARTDTSRDSGHRTPDSGRHRHVAGDPSYLAFRRAVADGALPFSCQGNENGLVIEGATTLVYEIVDELAAFDRIFIQVGGGALASACVQALADGVRTGRLAAMPKIHAVQTRGGHPLKRAYDRLVEHILARLAASSSGTRQNFATDADRAAYLLNAGSPALLDAAFAHARQHRSQFMWPWETEPRSIAGGILDDETYDWAAVVEGMIRSGGLPIVVNEPTIEEANRLARDTTGIDVDHTGSSGLAGLLALTRSADKPRQAERVVVLFTGVRRGA